MASVFKFRCYACEKLLKARDSTSGKVVHCPQCGVELIVPTPRDPEADSPEPEADAVRLEDLGLRIETDRLVDPPPTVAPVAPTDPSMPDPIAFLESSAVGELDLETEDSTDPPSEFSDEMEGLPQPSDPLESPLVPGSRRRGRSSLVDPASRRRDVTLPRTAAVAWALFALLSLAFAFLAGLLVGHFLWVGTDLVSR